MPYSGVSLPCSSNETANFFFAFSEVQITLALDFRGCLSKDRLESLRWRAITGANIADACKRPYHRIKIRFGYIE